MILKLDIGQEIPYLEEERGVGCISHENSQNMKQLQKLSKKHEIRQTQRIEMNQSDYLNCFLDRDRYDSLIDPETHELRHDGGKIKKRSGCQ